MTKRKPESTSARVATVAARLAKVRNCDIWATYLVGRSSLRVFRYARGEDHYDLVRDIRLVAASALTQREKPDWSRGRYEGKITMHWLRAAFDRIAAGEDEISVLRDFGYRYVAPRRRAKK